MVMKLRHIAENHGISVNGDIFLQSRLSNIHDLAGKILAR